VPPRSIDRDHAAALDHAGFRRHVVTGGTASRALEVYRRPTVGRWFLEARQEGEGAGHVDVGLTLEEGGGMLIGPIHRALSVAALASALPHIVESLEALAAAAESLRCPKCNSWAVMKEGSGGPYLACGEARRTRKPLERTIRKCRRNLIMAALIIHRDSKPPW
jgi:hypothetical protein